MKHLLGFAAFIMIAWGAGGLAHHFFDWFTLWSVVHRVGFLDGYEVFASIVLIVLGVAVGAASDRVRS